MGGVVDTLEKICIENVRRKLLLQKCLWVIECLLEEVDDEDDEDMKILIKEIKEELK